MQAMIDLHAHTIFSDGSDTPDQIVKQAHTLGLSLCAVTDHDTIEGIPEAICAGKEYGIRVLSGLEMDTVLDSGSVVEGVHLLAFGFNWFNDELLNLCSKQEKEREKRNHVIDDKLRQLGINISLQRDGRGKMISRTHFAEALVRGGYAEDFTQAFDQYLGQNGRANYEMQRIHTDEFIPLIHRAGGVVVIAHPGLMKSDPLQVIRTLREQGMDGVEVYYPAHRGDQMASFHAISLELNMFITSGSDYHGQFRKHVSYGTMAKFSAIDPRITRTFDILKAYTNI